MKRVVITGLGITSCIGNTLSDVQDSLKQSTSGISINPEYIDRGLRSHISGQVKIDLNEHVDRKALRFMGDAAGYAAIAMRDAIKDSGLDQNDISNERTGIIAGSGGASSANQVMAADILRERGLRRVGPYRVTQTMSSTVSACLATTFKIKGLNYSISSACSTSAHCIGNGMEQIQLGNQDIIFAGGGEEEHWSMSCLFDAMGALSSKYNDNPTKASRAYDSNRDGFVISGGGGMIVLEELEHAKARGAKIYAELVGYGATSDGADMVSPSGDGAARCMQIALKNSKKSIDYINSHGTSTPAGDIVELNAVKKVFGENIPHISSTKSLSGHSLGAAGVHEAIYSLIMMKNNFIAKSANIEKIDPKAINLPIVTKRLDNFNINSIMSNSFGFGGTNASLIFQKLDN